MYGLCAATHDPNSAQCFAAVPRIVAPRLARRTGVGRVSDSSLRSQSVVKTTAAPRLHMGQRCQLRHSSRDVPWHVRASKGDSDALMGCYSANNLLLARTRFIAPVYDGCANNGARLSARGRRGCTPVQPYVIAGA